MALNVATWDGVIGGPDNVTMTSASQIYPDSQLNFAPVLSMFGSYVDIYKTDSANLWYLFNLHLWPVDRRTDGGVSTILDEIIAGTHNQKYNHLGSRLHYVMAAKNIPVERMVVCPCSEANRRGPFQVFTSTTTKWQAAVTKAIEQIRLGSGLTNLRFMMVAARKSNLGPLVNWVPTNIDAFGMVFAPTIAVNSQATLNGYMDGTLDAGYGFTTDMPNFCAAKSIPMALPKWGPRYEWGATTGEQLACPVADLVVTDLYNNLVNKYRSQFLIDNLYIPQLLDPLGYQGPDAAGKAAWGRAVTNFKTLWSGFKLEVPTKPAIMVNPSQSGGSNVGSVLTTDQGTWSGTPTAYAYQWFRDTASIAGKTTNTYTSTTADVGKSVYCRVTASNAVGSTPAYSNGTTVTSNAPVNTALPQVTGSALVGSTLSCSTGTWNNSPDNYYYEWMRNQVGLGIGTTTYVTVAADVGKKISCWVQATNASGSTGIESSGVQVAAVPTVPTLITAPVVTGATPAGNLLSCSQGVWGGAPTSYAYQWFHDAVAISGQTSNSYVTVTSDVGQSVYCRVTASNTAGSLVSFANGITITPATVGGTPTAFLPVNFTAARNAYGPAAGGRTLYVQVGGSGSAVTDPAGGGNFLATVKAARDKDRVIVKRGGYSGFGSNVFPASGQQGNVQFLADNPVFDDVNTAYNAADGQGQGMLGYSDAEASQHTAISGDIRFYGWSGLWVEGFRFGSAGITAPTSGSGQLCIFDTPRDTSKWCWSVKNYFKDGPNSGGIQIGGGPGAGGRRGVHYKCYHRVMATSPGGSPWLADYSIFVDSYMADFYVTGCVLSGGHSQMLSVKQKVKMTRIHDNLFDHTYHRPLDGSTGSISCLLGQQCDNPNDPSNCDNAIVSYNRWQKESRGMCLSMSNITNATAEYNEFKNTGDGTPDAVRFDHIVGRNIQGTPQIILPPHPDQFVFQNNIFHTPSKFKVCFGSLHVNVNKQRTKVLIQNNTAATAVPSYYGVHGSLSGGADYQYKAKLLVTLGPNHKVDKAGVGANIQYAAGSQ